MTFEEEGRLWQTEMTASRGRYAAWLKHERRGQRAPDSVAITRARELIRQSREIVAESRALRSRDR